MKCDRSPLRADAPPPVRARHYGLDVTDPVTGEPVVFTARCDRPPTAEVAEALRTLAACALAAYHNGTLPQDDDE